MTKNDLYYRLDKIKETDADYNLVISGRSDGKTFASLEEILTQHVESDYVKQGAYLRRWDKDFSVKNNTQLFAGLVSNGVVERLTGGKWKDVYCSSRRWYLCNYDENGERTIAKEPFCYGFALNQMEHDKSVSYPHITTIVYDEFLTKSVELKNEWSIFLNVLSTIIRDRNDVKIYMLANTVSKYSCYWENFGINLDDVPINTIKTYVLGPNEELKVSIEYYNSAKRKKDSAKYFCFNDPHASMITSALWETDLFPHLPKIWNEKKEMEEYYDIKKENIDFQFFIIYQKHTLQCEWIDDGDYNFIYVHNKTTPIKNEDEDIVFTLESIPKWNWIPNLMKSKHLLCGSIRDMIIEGKVFFQSNMVGDTFQKYISSCLTSSQVLNG